MLLLLGNVLERHFGFSDTSAQRKGNIRHLQLLASQKELLSSLMLKLLASIMEG